MHCLEAAYSFEYRCMEENNDGSIRVNEWPASFSDTRQPDYRLNNIYDFIQSV